MIRPVYGIVALSLPALLLGSAALPLSAPVQLPLVPAANHPPAAPLELPVLAPTPASADATPAPAAPSPQQALEKGVLIVISLASQRLFVFENGKPWASSPVSTGRRGHDTPTGVFPILQKRIHHRSNLYDNAPMPYMQRLTWGGVALHAGRLPGYPASHGCIRLPRAFAKKLYAITDFTSTVVLVAHEPLGSVHAARALGSGEVIDSAAQEPTIAEAWSEPAAGDASTLQTIQLGATASGGNASALWQELLQRQPELGKLQHRVIPAIVHSRKVFRLRASGPGAHAMCDSFARAGVECLKVGG